MMGKRKLLKELCLSIQILSVFLKGSDVSSATNKVKDVHTLSFPERITEQSILILFFLNMTINFKDFCGNTLALCP